MTDKQLKAVYGGPTLLEALWAEMDTLMERLMTGQESDEDFCGRKGSLCAGNPDGHDPCEHPDNGDKYRAQELAWVLSIVSAPYNPSVDAIRAEAMRRWNIMQEAAAEQHDNAIKDGVTG